MSWLKKLGNNIWKTAQNVVSNPLVQSVASAVGLGGIANVADGVLNPSVATAVAGNVVETVAEKVNPVQTNSAVKQEIEIARSNEKSVSAVQSGNNDKTGLLMAGGLGLLAIMMITRK